jgi:hypothetical protein
VIRIRYSSELQPGLNGHAERHDRTTVVYLLPGLTPAERAAALRRLRQHGRMGRGPVLPRWQLGIALLADRVRMAFGQAGAIVRTHPAGSTLPVVAVSAAVAGFLLLSAVSIRIVHAPLAVGSGPARAVPVQTAGGTIPGAQAPGAQPRDRDGTSQPGNAPASSPAPVASGTGSGAPTPAPGSASTAPVTLSSAAATAPPPSSLQSPAPAPATSSGSMSPSAASPATSASSTTQVCVSIGPFGGCLGL